MALQPFLQSADGFERNCLIVFKGPQAGKAGLQSPGFPEKPGPSVHCPLNNCSRRSSRRRTVPSAYDCAAGKAVATAEVAEEFILSDEGAEARDEGEEALDVCASELPDLVILDLMLPKRDGYDVCRSIREFSLVPVVMLSAKGEQVDKLRGFEMGADDYLTKPFAPQELLARVQAVLRRSQQGAPPTSAAVVRCGPIAIDWPSVSYVAV